MTDVKWLACADPTEMLEILYDKVSDRKLKLFAVACCRRVGHLLVDSRSRAALEVAERFADGLSSEQELYQAHITALAAIEELTAQREITAAVAANLACESHPSAGTADMSAKDAARAISENYESFPLNVRFRLERKRQTVLLRHIIGNPFRPFAAPASWPSTITALAAALYNGEDCHYALADALMEAGHVELAEHFHEPGHSKGCWAVDLILGKK